ncbi:hypothetical protein ACB092_11G013900 [Castanea dentata]
MGEPSFSGLSKSERVLGEFKPDSLYQTPVKPPKARKEYHEMKMFGDVREEEAYYGGLKAEAKDKKGDEIYNINISNAQTGIILETIEGVTSNFEWAGEALVYIAMDKETCRPYEVYLHNLRTKQASDKCLYHEEDDKFLLYVQASEDKKFLFVTSASKTTSFNYYLDVSKPEDGLKAVTLREKGIDTSVSHRENYFFILRRTNELFNSEVVACPVACPLDKTAETIVLSHRKSVKIQAIQLFENHLVVHERENGLPKVTIYGLLGVGEQVQSLQGGFTVPFGDDPTYSAVPLVSEFNSSILQICYSTLKTPPFVYEVDMKTDRVVRKESATDCFDPSFEPSWLCLLVRGFICAIAHVRGGGEMGRQWYENGKFLKKENTFTDFIACAEYLIENKYCSKEKLSINGVSAGGLLICGVLNMRPDLFKAAVAQVPFVDVLTTMLDPTIPITTLELEEWGDPREEVSYYNMKSYSPVDNVKAQNYPNTLVTTAYHDARVMCSEPAKFVAKLRDQKTDENLQLLICSFNGGHFLERDAELDQKALIYAFIMKSLNLIPNP